MSAVLVCDLCGKPLDGRSSLFKVKRYSHIWELWEHIDVHDECIRKLMDAKVERLKNNESRQSD